MLRIAIAIWLHGVPTFHTLPRRYVSPAECFSEARGMATEWRYAFPSVKAFFDCQRVV